MICGKGQILDDFQEGQMLDSRRWVIVVSDMQCCLFLMAGVSALR